MVLLVGAGVHLLRVRWIREPYPAGAAGHLVEAEQAGGMAKAIEAGIPAGVLNVVPGFGKTAGEPLALHMRNLQAVPLRWANEG